MSLTKEKCEKALHELEMANKYPVSKYNDSRLIDFHLVTFEQLIEEYFEIIKEKERLEKALNKACELLEEQTEEGNLLCPCEYLGICHCMSTENGYECNGDNDYKWKEALMKDDE